MRTPPNENGANWTPKTVPVKWSVRAYRHAHTRRVAKNYKSQPTSGGHDHSISPAPVSSANLENKLDAYCVHLLRPLDRTIRDTHLLIDRLWHTIRE